jgi:hypothetical protein
MALPGLQNCPLRCSWPSSEFIANLFIDVNDDLVWLGRLERHRYLFVLVF